MNNDPARPGWRSAGRWGRAAALVALLFSACTPAASPTTRPLITAETPLQNTQEGWQGVATIVPSDTPVSPTATVTSIPTATPLPPTPQPTPTFNPMDWVNLPVLPVVSDMARSIYQKGLALGNRPNAFAKVGDCNSLSVRFLTYFDEDAAAYNLENYTYLQPVVDYFNGSFGRQSQAVGDGFNTSAILSPFRADPKLCKGGESPLACEYRLLRPSFAIIALGTDDYLDLVKFEANLRKVLETTIAGGIVPILSTKADNANQLNYNPIIARLAIEYDIPLWNLWRAMDPLPGHGLFDNTHPSGEFAAFDFSEDNLKRYGWTVRDLTALQALDAVWRGVTAP